MPNCKCQIIPSFSGGRDHPGGVRGRMRLLLLSLAPHMLVGCGNGAKWRVQRSTPDALTRSTRRNNLIKLQITPLAAILLAVAALATGNSAIPSDNDRLVANLTARAPRLQIDNFSADSFTIAQAAEVASPAEQRKEPNVQYIPTPHELVDVMLDMAKVRKDNVVYDLGSGDGRLVITAAKKYGASGIGIDIDPERIREATENAKKAGVEDNVRFLNQDLFESDFGDATVITLYLLDELNLRLRPRILRR